MMKSIVGLILIVAILFENGASSIIYSGDTGNDGESANDFSMDLRIQRGIIASPGVFTFMVPLWTERKSYSGVVYKTFCGASLISDEYLLTAANCVDQDASGFKVYIGARNITKDFEEGRIEMRIPLANRIMHEHYSWVYHEYDIALIRLPEKVNFTSKIQPVKLPKWNQTIPEGLRVTITGWGGVGTGLSSILNYGEQTVKHNDYCKGVFTGYIRPYNICLDGDQSPCSGDSGSPAVIANTDKSLTIVGFATYINPRTCARPAIYMKLPVFLDWIHNNTGIPIES